MEVRGLETMTAIEGREIIREIMAAYDKYLAMWLEKTGNATGFDEWFNAQINKP